MNRAVTDELKLKVIIILTLTYIACRFYFQHHVVSLFKLYGNNFKKLDSISDQKEVNGKNQRICGIPSSDYGIVFLRGAMLQWRHELNFLTHLFFISQALLYSSNSDLNGIFMYVPTVMFAFHAIPHNL